MLKSKLMNINSRVLLKMISLALIAALVLTVLVSCGSTSTSNGKNIMTTTYNDVTTSFTSNIYSYFLSYNKSMELYQLQYYYSNYYGIDIPDSAEIWNQLNPTSDDPEISTLGAYVKRSATEMVKIRLAAEAYCKENNLTLTKEQLNEIDVAIKELIKTDFEDSKIKFNNTLARFNINDQIYKEIRKIEAMYSMLGNHLFSSNGKRYVTDSEILKYYNDNFVRVKHILISTTPGEVDENGEEVKYTEEELAEKLAKADDIYNKIIGGEDFEDYYSESEDPGSESYPDGYCFTKNSGYVAEFEDAGFDMKIGEVRMVDTSYGKHIMKKYDLRDEDLEENRESINGVLQSAALLDELKPYMDNIEIDQSELDKYNIVSADTMLDCVSIIYY